MNGAWKLVANVKKGRREAKVDREPGKGFRDFNSSQ